MTDSTNPTDWRATMAEFARELRRERGSVQNTLDAITRLAVETVPGAEHAGITLVVGRHHRVESRSATSEIPRKLDEQQTQLQQGPTLRLVFDYDVVATSDLATEQRWPLFGAAAVDLGVRSMLAFKLYTDDRSDIGALNLYGATTGAFDADSVDAGAALAAHAAIALVAAQENAQLQSALATRDIIGQAKGMIMERFDVDAVRGFELLTRLSQESNLKVVDLARIIANRETLPGQPR